MGATEDSKAFKHPDGGGQIHIPKAVWNQYDIENGNTIEWWSSDRYKELIADRDDIIVLRIRRDKK